MDRVKLRTGSHYGPESSCCLDADHVDNLDFSEEEIQEQLAILGYRNIPPHRLHQFKRDLDELMRRGDWRSLASPVQRNDPEPQTDTWRPSPPAFTKEKVGRSCFQESAGGFPLKVDRQVLSTCPSGGDVRRQQQRLGDSYAQHSVAPRLRPPDPHRGHAPTPDSQRGRRITRKVLRKQEGQSLVCDESVHSEDSQDVSSCLDQHLEDLHLSTSPLDQDRDRDRDRDQDQDQDPDYRTDTEDLSDAGSWDTDGVSVSAFESYARGMTRSHSDGDVRAKPKSFIRPIINQHTIKKTDPVAKYFQYKQLWEMFKLPGESDRRALRLEIKERLEYQPPPPKPRRVFVPNSYVVPTEKKRSALRWGVRTDLATGLVPRRVTDT